MDKENKNKSGKEKITCERRRYDKNKLKMIQSVSSFCFRRAAAAAADSCLALQD